MLRLNEMSDSGEPLGAAYVYLCAGGMGKLSDFVSKGVRLIVVDPESSGGEAHGADAPASTRGPQPRDIPAEEIASPPPPPARSDVAMEIEDFGAVYDEAGVTIPDHGYGVDKIAEMLQGKRLSSLSREVRAQADGPAALLVAWIDECLYVHDIEGFVVRDVEMTVCTDTLAHGLLHGEPLDPARHRVGTVVKGATYHDVAVAVRDGVHEVKVIVDV